MLTLYHLFVVALVLSHPVTQGTPGCLPRDRTMDGLVVRVRFNVSRSPDDNWHDLDFKREDTATVRPVQADSLCRSALETINRYMSKSLPQVARIRLVYAGKYFVAEQAPAGPTHSEFWPQYILDSTLTKVLFPCSDGTATC